jgi:hypothetical protein
MELTQRKFVMAGLVITGRTCPACDTYFDAQLVQDRVANAIRVLKGLHRRKA